mmetsp:Transcript_4929/g.9802  ORF Transcript_4929/g.9802 Transcript_4929/m.9802 type:complete len:222 (-) Transcript_4929:102-767(-)
MGSARPSSLSRLPRQCRKKKKRVECHPNSPMRGLLTRQLARGLDFDDPSGPEAGSGHSGVTPSGCLTDVYPVPLSDNKGDHSRSDPGVPALLCDHKTTSSGSSVPAYDVDDFMSMDVSDFVDEFPDLCASDFEACHASSSSSLTPACSNLPRVTNDHEVRDSFISFCCRLALHERCSLMLFSCSLITCHYTTDTQHGSIINSLTLTCIPHYRPIIIGDAAA